MYSVCDLLKLCYVSTIRSVGCRVVSFRLQSYTYSLNLFKVSNVWRTDLIIEADVNNINDVYDCHRHDILFSQHRQSPVQFGEFTFHRLIPLISIWSTIGSVEVLQQPFRQRLIDRLGPFRRWPSGARLETLTLHVVNLVISRISGIGRPRPSWLFDVVTLSLCCLPSSHSAFRHKTFSLYMLFICIMIWYANKGASVLLCSVRDLCTEFDWNLRYLRYIIY